MGKSGTHLSIWCPSLLSALRRLFRFPCHPRWFRAQRTSASFSLSLRPGIVAVLKGLLPPKKCLKQLDRPSPAGSPLEGTKLVVQSTPEASLKRLVPLVIFLAAWKLLPNVSQWVLRTVERGFKIKFGAHPPLFNGVFTTLVGPEQDLVMEQEDTLRKEAIEVVPPRGRESGFYSCYFIVPKKGGGGCVQF